MFGSTQASRPNIKQSRIDALVLVSSFSNIVRPSVELTAKTTLATLARFGYFYLTLLTKVMAMVLIRTPELKDIPSLQKLFLQLGYQTDVERLENHINQKHPSLSILVAETEKELCGVIVMNFITPVHENGLWALISALVIDESSRGTGIGQKLLIASEKIALDQGCSQIELSSSERRVRAHKFYEKSSVFRVKPPSP